MTIREDETESKRRAWLSFLPSIVLVLALAASVKSNRDLHDENASLVRELQKTVKVAEDAVVLAKACAEKPKP